MPDVKRIKWWTFHQNGLTHKDPSGSSSNGEHRLCLEEPLIKRRWSLAKYLRVIILDCILFKTESHWRGKNKQHLTSNRSVLRLGKVEFVVVIRAVYSRQDKGIRDCEKQFLLCLLLLKTVGVLSGYPTNRQQKYYFLLLLTQTSSNSRTFCSEKEVDPQRKHSASLAHEWSIARVGWLFYCSSWFSW